MFKKFSTPLSISNTNANKKRKYEQIHNPDGDNESNEFKNNLFYVYDAKKKRLCSNFTIPNQMAKQDVIVDLNLKDKTYVLKPIENQNIRLFDMCLRFIADKIENVDSLIGFPSQIGELLFNECIKIGKFDSHLNKSNKISKSNLNLFADAYPDMLIESISLSNINKFAFLNFQSILSQCLIHSLDLSNVKLNEILQNNEIALSDLLKSSSTSLVYINLSSNDLDEDFLKKFTLPQRLNYVNFEKLATIDLSSNFRIPFSQNLINKYFNKFDSLNEIIITYSLNDSMNLNSKDYMYRLCNCCVNKEASGLSNTGWISKLSIEKLYLKSNDDEIKSSAEDYKQMLKEIRSNMTLSQESSSKIQLSFYKKASIKIEEETSSNKSNKILYNKRLYLKKYCKCMSTVYKNNTQIEQEKSSNSKANFDEKMMRKNLATTNSLKNLINSKDNLLKYYI